MKQSLALLLVLCLLAVGGLASAQSISHESHHAHHHKAAHGTVLCAWMCAAGQVLDTDARPHFVEEAPVALAEHLAFELVPRTSPDSPTTRGPPSYSI